MKISSLVRLVGGSCLTLAFISPTSAALPLVIDDMGGGPDTVSLTSPSPPELATGSFAYAGAVGGVRDVYVYSSTVGIFQAGVAFGTAGYSSFAGAGLGGIIWDGVAGSVDQNGDGLISVEDYDYGLNLDLVQSCSDPVLNLNAFADFTGRNLWVFLGNSATDYAVYSIPLTSVGAFADYSISLFAPTLQVGFFDPTSVRAISLLFDGSSLPDLDVQVAKFSVECSTVPEAGNGMAVAGLAALAGWRWRQVRTLSRK